MTRFVEAIGVDLKLVEATWDKRNLGITVQELSCPATVNVQELQTQLLSMDADLCVVRLSNSSVPLTTLLMKHCFIYRESMITFHKAITAKDLESSSKVKFDVEEADSVKLSFLFEQIRKGMFATDRISSDPSFGSKIGANRYINWINDELTLGASVKILSYKQKPIAFFVRRLISANRVYFALSGVFPTSTIPGAGIALQQEIVKEAARNQMVDFTTSVSTSNLGAIRVHIAAGFQIAAIESVFSRKLN